jgi:glycosyltransferase involved in cell wall biosynthesis
MDYLMTSAELAARPVAMRTLAYQLPSVAANIPPFVDTAGMRMFDIRALGSVVFCRRSPRPAEVVVAIPIYNYAETICETLASLLDQDLEHFSVVVIDDGSSDESGARAIEFLERHWERFANSTVIAHWRNQLVSMARNSGIAWTTEPYLFMLDADNRLRRRALSQLLDAVKVSGRAFAYPQLRLFGGTEGIGCADIWDHRRLSYSNYIDVMAMIRRDALLAAGGFAELADGRGWEDYDLWCRFAVLGFEGVFLPEVLGEYRVHGNSRTAAQTIANFQAMPSEMALRYPKLFCTRDDMKA